MESARKNPTPKLFCRLRPSVLLCPSPMLKLFWRTGPTALKLFCLLKLAALKLFCLLRLTFSSSTFITMPSTVERLSWRNSSRSDDPKFPSSFDGEGVGRVGCKGRGEATRSGAAEGHERGEGRDRTGNARRERTLLSLRSKVMLKKWSSSSRTLELTVSVSSRSTSKSES